jgi:hypothetical protein
MAELPVLSCVSCKNSFYFNEVEQIVVKVEGKKNKFFSFCCKACLEKLNDGDTIGVIDVGKLVVQKTFGFTKKTVDEMISRYVVSDYHFKLFEGWYK